MILQRPGAGPARFRVLNLRTPTAFGDEQGRRLEALESAGPTLVDCASFAVLLFPTAEGDEPWPDDPDAGWGRVPDRAYLDSASADPERWSRPGGVVVRLAPRGDRTPHTRPASSPSPDPPSSLRRRRSPVRHEGRARLDPGRRPRLAADVMVEWCPFH